MIVVKDKEDKDRILNVDMNYFVSSKSHIEKVENVLKAMKLSKKEGFRKPYVEGFEEFLRENKLEYLVPSCLL